ncbi:MAG: aminomethyl-transferring glycine dehydrogenase subunit GcvPA, partial [Anaerolineae bacterium]
VEDLFAVIPEDLRYPKVDLPDPVSELEVMEELRALAGANANAQDSPCFLGAGAYHHFIPSVVNHILLRSEFYTAYTPYQPEISQGTLQAIFEYQSMICALTGLEVSNASHYDGATSLAEAVIMAHAVSRGKKSKVVLSGAIHPEYREVVATYTQGMDIQLSTSALNDPGLAATLDLVDDDTACLAVQTPDFLGRIQDLSTAVQAAHAHGALLVVVSNPVALGMLKPGGDYVADIVVGEGQVLGNSLSFGGPYLGIFACRMEHVRRTAGRLVGQTNDANGRTGFVLTLSTREQHIRREKATSNICTNQGLNTLAAAVYMSALGKCGLSQVANLCYQKAHYAAGRIASLAGYKVDRSQPFFNEFVVSCPKPAAEINKVLYDNYGIIGGYDLAKLDDRLVSQMLICLTEMNSADQIDALLAGLEEAVK